MSSMSHFDLAKRGATSILAATDSQHDIPTHPSMTNDDAIFYDVETATPEDLRALGLDHNPFTALVVPRPIGWISTVSAAGVANLAPFSFFNAACQSPPIVMYCPNARHADGGCKDSLQNARDTGEFVVNLATWALRDKLNTSSATAPRSVDEFELAGLTKLASRRVAVPRVAEAPAHLECKVLKIVDLTVDERSPDKNTAVFGVVVAVHISRGLLVDGRVDALRCDPLARLGYLDYGRLGEIDAMPRPSWPLSAG